MGSLATNGEPGASQASFVRAPKRRQVSPQISSNLPGRVGKNHTAKGHPAEMEEYMLWTGGVWAC